MDITYGEAVAGLIHWAEPVQVSERSASCVPAAREAAELALAVPELSVLHAWARNAIEAERFAGDGELNRAAAELILNPAIVPDEPLAAI